MGLVINYTLNARTSATEFVRSYQQEKRSLDEAAECVNSKPEFEGIQLHHSTYPKQDAKQSTIFLY